MACEFYLVGRRRGRCLSEVEVIPRRHVRQRHSRAKKCIFDKITDRIYVSTQERHGDQEGSVMDQDRPDRESVRSTNDGHGDRASNDGAVDWLSIERRPLLAATAATLIAGVGASRAAETGRPGDYEAKARSQTAKFTPEDGDSWDRFGFSVALGADTALVGAVLDDNPNGEDAGAVYVFSRENGTWRQRALLTPDDGGSVDRFGYSMSLAKDTALVGAPGNNEPNGSRAGAAYVFSRSDDTWRQTAKLTPDDGDSGDLLGHSVALAVNTALVGAWKDEDPNGEEAGSAYVFSQEDDTWRQVAKLTPNHGESGDHFGESVALARDTALLGAPNDQGPNRTAAGSAYVFSRADSTWRQAAKLTPDDDGASWFGSEVALTEDTALVGAYGDENPNGYNAGSGYVFSRTDGTWTQTAKLTPDDGDREDRFGWSVALAGDTALVGADQGENQNGTATGAAYVFSQEDDSWRQTAKLTPDDGDAGDNFGSSVALADDAVLIGARRDLDPSGVDTGSAYAFDLRQNSNQDQSPLPTPGFGVTTTAAALGGGLLWRWLQTDEEDD